MYITADLLFIAPSCNYRATIASDNQNALQWIISNGPKLAMIVLLAYICYPFFFDLLRQMFKSDHDQVAPFVVKMLNFTDKKVNKEEWISSPFFAYEEGYQMCLRVDAAGYGDGEGTHVSVYLHLMKGSHDDKLEQSGHWPLRGTFTIELLNQFTDNDHYTRSMLLSGYLCSECTNRVVEGDMATGVGFDQFISHDVISDYVNHLIEDVLQFRISYENNDDPLPVDQVAPLIMNMTKFVERKKNKKWWYSSPFFAFDEGPLMCVHIYAAGYVDGEGNHEYISVYLQLMKGPHDDELERSGHWPLRGTFTIELLIQLNDSDHYDYKIVLYDYLKSRCNEREVEDYMKSIGHRYHQFVSRNILYNRANSALSFRIKCENISYPIPNNQVAPAILVMPYFTEKMKDRERWYSSPFFAFNGGCQMCLRVDAAGYGDGEGTHVSVYLHLMKGPHDDKLEQSDHWPLRGTFTIELLNQFTDNDHYTRSMLLSGYLCSECTNRVVEGDMATGVGFDQFISHDVIPDYVNHDILQFRITYENNDVPLPVDHVAPLIMNMTKFTKRKKNKEQWYSSPFFAFNRGYIICVHIYAAGYGDGEGTHVSVFLHLMKGPHDDKLEQSGHWPLRGTFTIELLNQLNDNDHYDHKIELYDYLRNQCSEREVEDYMNSIGHGYHQFVSHNIIFYKKASEYLKNDTISFRIKYEDISYPIPNNQVAPVTFVMPNFTEKMKSKNHWYSSPFLAFTEGYQMCLRVVPVGFYSNEVTDVSVLLYLMKGPHDDKLEQSGHWPLRGTFTIELLNQLNDSDHFIFTTSLYHYLCNKCSARVTDGDIAPKGWGSKYYISREAILHQNSKQYFNNDALHFRISYEDTRSSTPHDQLAPVTFTLCNITSRIKKNELWFSVPFFAFKEGYKMTLVLRMGGYKTGKGTHVSFYVRPMKGPHDDNLEQLGYWPLRGTFTIELLNQLNDSDHHSQEASMEHAYDKCSLCTNRVLNNNIAPTGWGSHRFISHKAIFQDGKYLKNDCADFRISYEDTGYSTSLHQIAPFTIRMDKVTEYIKHNDRWYSVPFHAFKEGYTLHLKVYGSGYDDGHESTHLSVLLCLMKGPHDDTLDWPMSGTFVIELLNQLNNNDHYIRAVVVNGHLHGVCTDRVKQADISDKCCPFNYISHKILYSKTNPLYLFNDSLLFRISYEHNPPISHKVAPFMLNVSNFTKRYKRREHWSSSPFYASEGGYQMCVSIDFASDNDNKNTYITVSLHLLNGPYDDELQQSGQWPLNGVFLIELQYHYRVSNDCEIKKEKIYYFRSETCGSCVTLIAEGYGNKYVIPLKHLHAGLKNDEIHLNISYRNSSFYVFIWNWFLEELMVFTGLCLLDSLFTFVLLVFIKACRDLIETYNTSLLPDIVEYFLIAEPIYKHTMKMTLFIVLTVIGKALPFILWEFTNVITYNSAIIMKDIISRTLIIILLMNVHTIVSPVWMMYFFSETCSALYSDHYTCTSCGNS